VAYDRNATARSKGYRNYYEYRKAQSQAKGYRNPYQEAQVNQAIRSLPSPTPTDILIGGRRAEAFGDLSKNPIWESQVPSEMKSSLRLQRAFKLGFLGPLGSKAAGIVGHKMSVLERKERDYFLDAVPDFDWDQWNEYAEEEGNS
jgi:hypothetical protein